MNWPYELVRWEAGLDYLTVVSNSQFDSAQLDKLGWAMVEQAEAEGGIIKPAMIGGYEGYMVNSSFYGVRYDGCMVRVSGAGALGLAQAVDWWFAHPTRIDVQITAWFDSYDPCLAEVNYAEALSYREANPKLQLAHPVLIKGGAKGSTLILGSRSSPKYGRHYDKYAESKDDYYYGAWRWECEYKADGAQEVVRRLSECDWDHRACAGIVVGQWEAWGCWIPTGLGTGAEPIVLSRRKSDVETRLQWLREQVGPSVRELMDLGHTKKVIEALGLDVSCETC